MKKCNLKQHHIIDIMRCYRSLKTYFSMNEFNKFSLSGKYLSYFVICYILAMGIFIGLGYIAAALPPTKSFCKNAKKTISYISGKKSTRSLLQAGKNNNLYLHGVVLDDFTDTLILNNAFCYGKNGDSAFKSAMQNTIFYSNHDKSKEWRLQHTAALFNYPEVSGRPSPYNRYWFGTSVIVKIAHYFSSSRTIYSWFGYIVVFLIFAVFAELLKFHEKMKAWAFLLFMMMLHFYACFQSFQYSPAFIIALGGTLIGLHAERKKYQFLNKYLLLFCLGMLCAYFDLLTTPLLTAFTPLLFMSKGENNVQDKTQITVTVGWKLFVEWGVAPVCWLVGYVASWGTKLLIADYFNGCFLSNWERILLRSSSESQHIEAFSRWSAIAKNWQTFYDLNRVVFCIVLMIAACILCWQIWHVIKKRKQFDCKKFAGYCCYALVPICFIFIMANHSRIHYWMTYRNISIAVTALFLSLSAFTTTEGIENE